MGSQQLQSLGRGRRDQTGSGESHLGVHFLTVEDLSVLLMWPQSSTWPFADFPLCKVGHRLGGPCGGSPNRARSQVLVVL